jgi:hypothetical protein
LVFLVTPFPQMLRNLLSAIAEMSASREPAGNDVAEVCGLPAKRLRFNQDPTATHDLVAPGMPVQFLCDQQKSGIAGCLVSSESALLIWVALLHILCFQPDRETGIALKDKLAWSSRHSTVSQAMLLAQHLENPLK